MDHASSTEGPTPVEAVETGASQQDPATTPLGYEGLHNAADLVSEYCVAEPIKALPTGFRLLDEQLRGGLRHQGLYILAGRPREGKSSLALSMSRRMAVHHQLHVLYLSLEMAKHELVERLICQATLTPLEEIEQRQRTKTLQPHLARMQRELQKAWLHIEDLRGAQIGDLNAIWSEMKSGQTTPILPDVLMIDHLQQVTFSEGVSRADAMTTYLSDLKRFAKTHHVAILVCCQINRQGHETPSLVHLKGSGGIEENADAVFIGARKLDEGEAGSDDCEYELWIAKHRRGPESKINLTFRPPCCEFLEPSNYGRLVHPALETEVNDDLVKF